MAISKRCAELLCLTYTLLLFASGLLLVAFSVYLGYKLIYHNFVVSVNIAPFVLVFVFGLLHVALTWLGWKGPTREHLFHIIMFFGITGVYIAAETAVAIWTLVLKGQTSEKLSQILTNSFYGFVLNNYNKQDWEDLQTKLQCCGISNHTDYFTISKKNGSIPYSCFNSTSALNSVYETGCKEPLLAYVKKILLDISLITFGSVVFQIIGIIIFYYFYKTVKAEVARRNEVMRRTSRIQEAPLNRQNSQAVPPKAVAS